MLYGDRGQEFPWFIVEGRGPEILEEEGRGNEGWGGRPPLRVFKPLLWLSSPAQGCPGVPWAWVPMFG